MLTYYQELYIVKPFSYKVLSHLGSDWYVGQFFAITSSILQKSFVVQFCFDPKKNYHIAYPFPKLPSHAALGAT